MAALTNRRHERFAQLLHRYGNQRRAYMEAGYQARGPARSVDTSPADRCATRLRKYVQVEQRLQELRAMAQTRHLITVDTLLQDLEADRQLAHTTEQSGAAVSATMAKARLLGLVIERSEKGAPGDFAAVQSVSDVIALLRNELGEQAAEALAGLLAAPEPPATVEIEAEVEPEPEATHEPPGSVQ